MLAHNLKTLGLEVFYDEWSLVPCGELVTGLYDGLQHARAGILVVSPEATNSGWVGEEDALEGQFSLYSTSEGRFKNSMLQYET